MGTGGGLTIRNAVVVIGVVVDRGLEYERRSLGQAEEKEIPLVVPNERFPLFRLNELSLCIICGGVGAVVVNAQFRIQLYPA